MIRIVSIQQAYKNKIRRQEELADLKYRSHGSCAYIGDDISPGCYGCFHSDAFYCGFLLGRDLGLPDVCNRDCVYCFEPHLIQDDYVPVRWKLTEAFKDSIKRNLPEEKFRITTEVPMQYYDFTGLCEPLLYMPAIEQLMRFLREEVDVFMGVKGWAKIYTNGTLLDMDKIKVLKDLGFDEIRIHPGATNFSDKIYDITQLSTKYIPTVTVETPAWPPHREKHFQMLPIINSIGVKHLDICQVEITSKKQLDSIEQALGSIEIYQAFYPVMDDGGLVEDIMREVVKRNYAFSVIDCNGFVKQSRSALSNRSYWNILNRKYPPEWEQHRNTRVLKRI
jgi:pyruvate formate-lyase activating enzyme-like uncharacterized protein